MSTTSDRQTGFGHGLRHAPARLAVAGLAVAVPLALAARVGGYLPSAWGVIGIGAALVLLAGIILGRPVGSRRIEAIWIACFLALGAWQLVSTVWTTGDGAAVADAEITLLYALCAAACLTLVSRRETDHLIVGIWAAALAVSLWGLGRHLLPGHLGGEAARVDSLRLAGPMGYTNAAGAVAGLGLLLSVALLAHRGRRTGALAAAAAVPFATTLYLTLSRGAMLATVVGLVVLLVLDRRRLDVAVSTAITAMPVSVAVWLAGRLPGTTGSAPYALMQSDGRRLALELVPVVALAAGAGLVRLLVPSSAGISRAAAWRTGIGVAAVLAACLALVLVREGGPVALVERGVDSFAAQPPADPNGSSRLLNASGTVRASYWRVAWRMVEREPLLGEGAGSYGRWWIQDRPTEEGVRNAHNLYLDDRGFRALRPGAPPPRRRRRPVRRRAEEAPRQER